MTILSDLELLINKLSESS